MSANLSLIDLLSDPARAQEIASRGAALIETEVSSRSGLAALALKAGYKAVSTLKPQMIESALLKLMPRFAPELQPHIDAALAGGSLEGYFAAHAEDIAAAMLSVTDQQVEAYGPGLVASTYQALRGQALKQTTQSMPAVGQWLEGLRQLFGGSDGLGG